MTKLRELHDLGRLDLSRTQILALSAITESQFHNQCPAGTDRLFDGFSKSLTL